MAERRLHVFSAVARHLSFTKAAKELHMSQPAVTFNIRQLEEHLNTRLFERSHNHITLTRAGELVRQHADTIVAQYQVMEEDVRKLLQEKGGTLILGASTTVGEYFIPSVVGGYRAEFPNTRVRMKIANTEGIIKMIEEKTIDVGIVEGLVERRGSMVSKAIWRDELVVVCTAGHAWANKKSISIAEVLASDDVFIGREDGSGTREVLENYLVSQGKQDSQFNILMEFGSPESIKGVVTAGLGISILSVATIEKELELKRLCAVPLKVPLYRAFTMVYHNEEFNSKTMEQFVAFTEQWCQGHAAKNGG